ncbi:MAG: hypothetical protein M0R67_03670 [Candidatus Cloacimonas sp.]|nr:hypothetical protein [Candidatus Cloacimonas sp.]
MKRSLLSILCLLMCLSIFAIDNKFLHQLAYIKTSQAYSIRFAEDLVYANNQNYIWVYSIFNAWQPKMKAAFFSPNPIEDIETLTGKYLYVASNEPTNQVILIDSLYTGSRIFFPQTIVGDKLTREGSILYVADRYRGIDIIDLGGGSTRELLSTFSEKWGIKDFVASYPYIFALNDFGLVAVDITDQSYPVSLGVNYELIDATCLAKNGNTIWIGAGKNLLAFNVYEPKKPTLISQIRMTNEILSLDIKDNRLFIVLGRGGVKIVDVTNPLKTEDLNNIFLTIPVYDLDVANDYIFLGLGKEGWMIYEYR